jgi:Arc/MetJ-type ribon-helix-helix transcriptional regulator
MPSSRTQNLSLVPEMEVLIDGQVASVRCRGASEVVRAARRLLEEDKRTRKEPDSQSGVEACRVAC